MSTKEERMKIFEKNQQIIKSDKDLTQAVQNSIEKQELILEVADMTFTPRFEQDAKVTVTKHKTFEAARNYNGHVAVLNFASATNPGGGVLKGSSAQEECLCRESTLFNCINTPELFEHFYKQHREHGNALHNDDLIFTPDVVVFLSENGTPLWRRQTVSVITCAAPNLKEVPTNQFNTEHGGKVTITPEALKALHMKRAEKILSIAAAHNVDTIILGAFGCGAFRNDPNVVAEAYKEVLPKFLKCFKNIEFAVYCRDDQTNFEVFKKVLE